MGDPIHSVGDFAPVGGQGEPIVHVVQLALAGCCLTSPYESALFRLRSFRRLVR
jgi:hypothetical protein